PPCSPPPSTASPLLLLHPPPPFSLTDPAPTDIYTLSLHDALPISATHQLRTHAGSPQARRLVPTAAGTWQTAPATGPAPVTGGADRKSTRLNSSHVSISYAVFCLKKKKP